MTPGALVELLRVFAVLGACSVGCLGLLALVTDTMLRRVLLPILAVIATGTASCVALLLLI